MRTDGQTDGQTDGFTGFGVGYLRFFSLLCSQKAEIKVSDYEKKTE